ncbi:hypothetical protein DID77_00285 [Candidatus Marinamargulisbacteria bacterium SCGC AG-439-L15]|nr:hypothetical protein DID77_00285 [Candidatus Marinamargulisbacteria bacterium SCGC AG-439-L15]
MSNVSGDRWGRCDGGTLSRVGRSVFGSVDPNQIREGLRSSKLYGDQKKANGSTPVPEEEPRTTTIDGQLIRLRPKPRPRPRPGHLALSTVRNSVLPVGYVPSSFQQPRRSRLSAFLPEGGGSLMSKPIPAVPARGSTMRQSSQYGGSQWVSTAHASYRDPGNRNSVLPGNIGHTDTLRKSVLRQSVLPGIFDESQTSMSSTQRDSYRDPRSRNSVLPGQIGSPCTPRKSVRQSISSGPQSPHNLLSPSKRFQRPVNRYTILEDTPTNSPLRPSSLRPIDYDALKSNLKVGGDGLFFRRFVLTLDASELVVPICDQVKVSSTIENVYTVLDLFRSNPGHFKEEGLFRVAPSETFIRHMLDCLKKGDKELGSYTFLAGCLGNKTPGINLSSLLKRLLVDLFPKSFSQKLYDSFQKKGELTDTQFAAEVAAMFGTIKDPLLKDVLSCFKELCQFFKEVISYESDNKMDLSNLLKTPISYMLFDSLGHAEIIDGQPFVKGLFENASRLFDKVIAPSDCQAVSFESMESAERSFSKLNQSEGVFWHSVETRIVPEIFLADESFQSAYKASPGAFFSCRNDEDSVVHYGVYKKRMKLPKRFGDSVIPQTVLVPFDTCRVVPHTHELRVDSMTYYLPGEIYLADAEDLKVIPHNHNPMRNSEIAQQMLNVYPDLKIVPTLSDAGKQRSRGSRQLVVRDSFLAHSAV